MPIANMTTGAAATSRCVRKYTAEATRSNTTPTKNTRRPSRSRSRNAQSLYRDPAATLDDLREAETTLTQLERTSRRVLGGAHPVTVGIEKHLRRLRIVLGIREMAETPPGSS